MTQWGLLTTALHSGQQIAKLKKNSTTEFCLFKSDILGYFIFITMTCLTLSHCGAISKWLIELSNY